MDKEKIVAILKKHESMVDNWNKAVFPPYKFVAKEIVELFEKQWTKGFEAGLKSVKTTYKDYYKERAEKSVVPNDLNNLP